MRFGKRTLFFILQGIMLLILLLHLGRWLFSDTVEARVSTPYSATVMTAHYTVKGATYTNTYMRNGFPLTPRTVTIRYLTYNPKVSRINSFMSILAEPLAWWLVLSSVLAALLLMNNTVFSKGTRFQLHKHFPWISMDEYFPIKSRWFYKGGRGAPSAPEGEARARIPSR